MAKEKLVEGKLKEENLARASCNDIACPVHGRLKLRGRTFFGEVVKKFHKRVVIEFERNVLVKKYERYAKIKTRIHSRLPECMEDEIEVGDYIKVAECRPLSKMVHTVVIKKIKGKKEK